MPDFRIEASLAASGLNLEATAVEKVRRYVTLLTKWNSRVNLVSSTQPDILVPLILEALWAAEKYRSHFKTHLDIGSGAGFPAIPLAIKRTDVEVTLLEGREKKAAFLETVAHDLGLGNVRVANERLDAFLRRAPEPGPWDCVSWKAVRVGARDFQQLLKSTRQEVRFWVFHGRDFPIEDPESVVASLETSYSEACPFHSGWFLSEYCRRTVSRETG